VTAAPSTATAPPAAPTSISATPTLTPAQRLVAADDVLKQGDSGCAIELLLALKASDPSAPGLDDTLYRAYLAHGKRLLDAGELDGSWAMYARALEMVPNDPAARDGQNQIILAKDWRTMETAWGNNDDAALVAGQEIARIDPTYRDIRDKLYALLIARADRLLAAGDRDGAYGSLMQGLEVRPDGAEARERLRPYTPTPTPFAPPTSPPRPVQVAPAQSAPPPAVQPVVQPAPEPAPAPTAAPVVQPAPAPVGTPIRR
jgi:tetratricopeptide (TPR) repeat protein